VGVVKKPHLKWVSNMQLTFLKSKIHRANVTHCELDYEGSCAIDARLLQLAGIYEHEQVHIYNVNNGERFVTYAIYAEENSGIISLNGAAARKAYPGDRVIICTYVQVESRAADKHQPQVIYVDDKNRAHT